MYTCKPLYFVLTILSFTCNYTQVGGELQGSLWDVRLQRNSLQPRESEEGRDLCHEESDPVRIVATNNCDIQIVMRVLGEARILPEFAIFLGTRSDQFLPSVS